jgi:hypothetical protein
MDIEDIKHLTDAQKERYMILQRGFESQFWELLKAWALSNANEQLGRLFYSQSWDQHLLARGAHDAFKLMSDQEQSVELEFANYAKEAQEAEVADDEEGNQL